ncbi:hypothetical protein Tco_1566703, partial [Tanacetum coccineum]
IVNPSSVKNEVLKHFSNRFDAPVTDCITFVSSFPNQLTPDQVIDLESSVDSDKIKCAVWDWDTNKYSLPPGCNSSFIALIPKTQEAKMVKDFRLISLIGSVYKIITKVLANQLSHVISNLVSDVQSAFIPDRQILDGPFILNELLSWLRWDYLDAVLFNFGFGTKWRSWIQGFLNSAMGSILVNGSPTTEFKFFKVKAGLFKGIHINDSLILSHLFYADDVIFIGEWNLSNIQTIVNVLKWFHVASGLKINLHKSRLMGIRIPQDVMASSARSIGCSILHMPFHYLGVIVGGSIC